jgi:hypothetical protein
MDSKMYPQGKAPHYTKYVNGVLKFFKRSSGAEMFAIDGNNGVVYKAGEQRVWRVRATVAQVNAGFTLVDAVPGYKIQMVDATVIAVGGNVTGATAVDIKGTQSASVVKLLAAAAGGLTRSTILKPDTATHAAVLADGVSFAPCDANTAITVIKDGSDVATATHIDVTISYVLVRA